jgi:hypothetical protein
MAAWDPYSTAARGLNVAARTAHLLAVAVVAGGVFFGTGIEPLRPWIAATAASGAALLALEASHSRHWIYQGSGLAVLAHLGAAGLIAVDGLGRPGAVAALVIGAVGSHLPRSVRRWSLRHRRMVD